MQKHTIEYDRYMRSDEWAKKRAERLEIDSYKCVMCQRPHYSEKYPKGILQIHHIHYKNLGNENVFDDLVTLCPTCHKRIHRYYARDRGEKLSATSSLNT